MGDKSTQFSLTGDETALLEDTSFFLRKRQLSARYLEFLGTFESALNTELASHMHRLPEPISGKRGKISRGENYLGLPYMLLDHPAVFGKEGIFAFRTLLWWGHPFSFTFHLSGTYLVRYLEPVLKYLQQNEPGLMVCINTSMWEHHHEPTNYIPVTEANLSRDFFESRNFLKISKTVPLRSSHLLMETGLQFVTRIVSQLT